MRQLANSGSPNTFLTLTSNPATGDSPTDRAIRLVRGWRELARRIKRRFSLKTLPYLYVVEATKRGEPHLHVLLRAPFIPQGWLSTQWEAIVGAPIVHIERITSERGAARYVSKYIAKAPFQFRQVRRYNASRTWRIRRATDPPIIDWKNIELRELLGSLEHVICAWRSAGWRLETAGAESVLAFREDATGPPPFYERARFVR